MAVFLRLDSDPSGGLRVASISNLDPFLTSIDCILQRILKSRNASTWFASGV